MRCGWQTPPATAGPQRQPAQYRHHPPAGGPVLAGDTGSGPGRPGLRRRLELNHCCPGCASPGDATPVPVGVRAGRPATQMSCGGRTDGGVLVHTRSRAGLSGSGCDISSQPAWAAATRWDGARLNRRRAGSRPTGPGHSAAPDRSGHAARRCAVPVPGAPPAAACVPLRAGGQHRRPAG